MRFFSLLATILLSFSIGKSSDSASVDVVILSGSEAGFTAAIQAARMGKTVALIEPTGHPGGMAVEGIAKDIKHGSEQVLGGIVKDFYRGIAAHYGRPDPFTLERWIPAYEPSAASSVIEAMLVKHPEIRVFRNQRIKEGATGVVKEGSLLKAVILEDGTQIAGKVFIDASIEGHLLHFAGVTTATGRESNETYNETLNGIREESRHRQFQVRVDPYIEPGNPESGLIPTVQSGDLGTPGSADPHIMGFCFRLCLTRDSDNVVPIEKPDGYLPETYEIYRRYFAAGGKFYSPSGRLPGGKTDLGSWHDLSANLYGENVGYPAGSYKELDQIVQYHENFTRGMIWFLQNDPAVPEADRKKWEGWGLCRDEFSDNDHWPRRLYIRSARRMVSDFVHTEHHTRWPNPEPVADPVAMAWWPPDMHHARRIVRDGAAYNEGFVYGDGGWSPFGISYRSLVPKRAEAINLITPTCPSSSYIGYSAIRILPTFMMLGQSVATAACLALDKEIAIQDVPYAELQKRLKGEGMILAIPEDASWDGKKKISYGGVGEPGKKAFRIGANRCSGAFEITEIPGFLNADSAEILTVSRGPSQKAGSGFSVDVNQSVEVFVLVQDRGNPTIPDNWEKVPDQFVYWKTPDGKKFRDIIYRVKASKGSLKIPPHNGTDGEGWHGIPHAVVFLK